MPTINERLRELRTTYRKANNLDLVPATVITKDGQIVDPLIPGNYWVSYQTSNGLSTTRSVRGPAKTMPLSPGAPVLLETFRGRLRIRELDTDRMLAAGSDPVGSLQKVFSESVQQGRFETLRLIPKGGLIVSLRSWNIILDGVYYEFSYPDVDLTSHVPGAGEMRYATIFVKNDLVDVEVIDSTARGENDLPLDSDDVQECLDGATGGSTATWAVKLVGGQTDVTQDDVDNDAKDLRQIVNSAVDTGVTSVALTAAPTGIFDVSGSPVTGAGTLALSMDNQNANTVLAGPSSGAAAIPAFRALVHADLPQLQHICQGRLTLETGVPVSVSDQTAKTTLYFTPYKGGLVGLYSGTAWVLRAFTELSIAVPSTTNTLYDVFIYDNAGAPTLETLAWNSPTNGAITNATNATPIVVTYTGTDPANDQLVTIAGVGGNTAANGTWRIANINTGAKTFELKTLANGNSTGNGAFTTNGTWQRQDENQARATALTTQDGVLVKSGATTRRYLGTIRTTTTSGQCEDSLSRRFVWNYYNRVNRNLYVSDATANWTYATLTWRGARDDLATRIQFVIGYAEEPLFCKHQINASVSATSTTIYVGIGVDKFTTGPDSQAVNYTGFPAGAAQTLSAFLFAQTGPGYHYLEPMELANATATFYGGANMRMEGMVMA